MNQQYHLCVWYKFTQFYFGVYLSQSVVDHGNENSNIHYLGHHEGNPNMCCDLVESVGCQDNQKKEWIAFVFYCLENPSGAHKFGTTGPIHVGVSAQCTSPNEHLNQVENKKCHMFNFRLIPLDNI